MIMRNTKNKVTTALFLLALLVSCATAPPAGTDATDTVIVFPPPPDEARFYFERTIVGSADIEQPDSETRWRRLLTGETISSRGLSKPFDIEACEGTIYVSDTVARSVIAFDVPSGQVSEIGDRQPGLLRKPLGLAVDSQCNLYVADQTDSRIVVYDREGEYLNAIGGQEDFDRLSHVAVDPDGTRLYAVDTGGVRSDRHQVRVYDAQSGEHLFDFGGRGTAEGEFNLARDIAMGPDGNIYVVDGGNFRVQIFLPDGTFISQIGSIGVGRGQFSRPKGIDTDADGNIYVSDTSFANFQIFDADGQLLMHIGDRAGASAPAAYMLPAGIAVDEDGRIYIVDQYFRKIDIFRPAALGEDEGFLATRTEPAK